MTALSSYDVFERSARSGAPFMLYRFMLGGVASNNFCFTDSDHPISFDGNRFSPFPIKVESIKFTGTLDKSDINITVDRMSEIAQIFLVYPPSYVVEVEIYRGHAEDKTRNFLRLVSCRVLSCSFQNAEATLTCQQNTTSLLRPGLRRNFQRQCPLVLYGLACKALKVALVSKVVSVPGTNSIRVTPASMPGDPTVFIGGTIEWVKADGFTEIRNILTLETVSSDFLITISGPSSTVAVAQSVNLFRGCAHNEAACEEIPNATQPSNIQNFGGQAWIPFNNPINVVSTFF